VDSLKLWQEANILQLAVKDKDPSLAKKTLLISGLMNMPSTVWG
jgi:hypothetical protein